ncbi:MAG: hypothetical protein JEZ03_13005 [Bacteroidales bacterium]|nr:hypothetical protein [Bacteroidales bacterium]
MDFIELDKRSGIDQNEKMHSRYVLFEKLIDELKIKEIPSEIVNSINQDISAVNAFSGTNKEFLKNLIKAQTRILKLIETELKLVVKNHYRSMWLAIGMGAFGIPFGVAFGSVMGNMAFIGIGLPLGMALGMAYGTTLDKKAFESGKQLDLDLI